MDRTTIKIFNILVFYLVYNIITEPEVYFQIVTYYRRIIILIKNDINSFSER